MRPERKQEINRALEVYKEKHQLQDLSELEFLVDLPDMVGSIEQAGLGVPSWASAVPQKQPQAIQEVLSELGHGITTGELKWYLQTWGFEHDYIPDIWA